MALLVYLGWACLAAFIQKNGPKVAVAGNTIMMVLVVGFKIFRHSTNNTKFHEYLVIFVVSVNMILCIITNTNHLPEKLMGPGLD